MVKPPVLSAPSSRRRLLGAFSAFALTTALAISGGTLANAASTQSAVSPVAPALDGSAAGGKVIVVLKQQQSGMNLRTQASQRIAAAHADQAPIVASIRSHGGTGVTQLAAPDAIAADVPAGEVAQLRGNPAVAEIVPDAMIQVAQVHTEAAPPAAASPSRIDVKPSGSGQPGNGQSSATIPALRTHIIPVVQESYDDGTPGRVGRSPDIQHAEVADPSPGRWTAKFLWGGIDDYVELPPATPGTYRGPMSFRISGQDYLTAPAIRPVTIPARSSASVPLHVAMPVQPGDHPESVQLSASNGAADSVPIARRTLIPSGGGSFQTLIIGTSARSVGQINTYEISVPAGQPNLSVALHTADASPDNVFNYYLVNPSGTVVATASTPQTVNGEAVGDAELSTANPVAGLWQIDVVLRLTVSGNEFTQTVYGNVTEGGGG